MLDLTSHMLLVCRLNCLLRIFFFSAFLAYFHSIYMDVFKLISNLAELCYIHCCSVHQLLFPGGLFPFTEFHIFHICASFDQSTKQWLKSNQFPVTLTFAYRYLGIILDQTSFWCPQTTVCLLVFLLSFAFVTKLILFIVIIYLYAFCLQFVVRAVEQCSYVSFFVILYIEINL